MRNKFKLVTNKKKIDRDRRARSYFVIRPHDEM